LLVGHAVTRALQLKAQGETPLGSPEAASKMEALLLELQQLNDQAEALTEAGLFDEWFPVNRRRMEVVELLDAVGV
jgi:hypothetical protein